MSKLLILISLTLSLSVISNATLGAEPDSQTTNLINELFNNPNYRCEDFPYCDGNIEANMVYIMEQDQSQELLSPVKSESKSANQE